MHNVGSKRVELTHPDAAEGPGGFGSREGRERGEGPAEVDAVVRDTPLSIWHSMKTSTGLGREPKLCRMPPAVSSERLLMERRRPPGFNTR